VGTGAILWLVISLGVVVVFAMTVAQRRRQRRGGS